MVEISNGTFDGTVSAAGSAGGLVGDAWGRVATASSRVHGEVASPADLFAGGVVGSVGSVSIDRTAFEGSVSGLQRVGGLVGFLGARETSFIVESYARGTVEATIGGAGGLIGVHERDWRLDAVVDTTFSIADSFFNGSVEAPNDVGGLLGSYSNDSDTLDPDPVTATSLDLARSYSAGALTGPVGPNYFVGTTFPDDGGVNTVSSYCTGDSCPEETRVTTEQLKSREFLANTALWDFEDRWCYSRGWNDDYPLLLDVTSGSPHNLSCWVYGQQPPRSHRSRPRAYLAPEAFFIFGNFFCTQCSDIYLIWKRPSAAPDADEVVTDAAGRRVCATGVQSFGDWRICFIPGLSPGGEYTYSLKFKRGRATGSTINSSITLLGG